MAINNLYSFKEYQNLYCMEDTTPKEALALLDRLREPYDTDVTATEWIDESIYERSKTWAAIADYLTFAPTFFNESFFNKIEIELGKDAALKTYKLYEQIWLQNGFTASVLFGYSRDTRL